MYFYCEGLTACAADPGIKNQAQKRTKIVQNRTPGELWWYRCVVVSRCCGAVWPKSAWSRFPVGFRAQLGGHVGAMLGSFWSLFEVKCGILRRRHFQVDFYSISEPHELSKMSVSCRREANFQ